MHKHTSGPHTFGDLSDVGGGGLSSVAAAGDIDEEQFRALVGHIGARMGVDMAFSSQVDELWKAADAPAGHIGRVNCAAIAAALASYATKLPLSLLTIQEVTQHRIDVEWTWNGLPGMRWKRSHWEAHPESGVHFHLEIAKISPAYGIRAWHPAAIPTRKLVSQALVAPQATWEEHVEVKGTHGELEPFLCSGAPEDYALRVRAVNRGGSAPPSNVVIARPSRTREAIELDLPGPLPQSVRDILDIEDQLKSEEKLSGMSAVEQFERLREVLGRQLPELSQLFRLFAMTRNAKLHKIYSLSHAQFRGFCIAIGISPQTVGHNVADVIFTRARRMLNFKVGNHAKAEGAKSRMSTLTRAMNEAGGLTGKDDELGFTQFVAGMIRVAHAAYAGVANGLGAQLDMMMDENVLPVHKAIAHPARLDRFLRSRAATCVFIEHATELRALFKTFSVLDKSSSHARVHSETMNIGEWLQVLTSGGYFKEAMETSRDNICSDLDAKYKGGRPKLSHMVAVRIFIEVNLEDVQLDMVPLDAVHMHKTFYMQEELDLYSEVVYDEFCLCVGSLMPYCEKVLRRSAKEPGVTHAQLLDDFLIHDFLPRFHGADKAPTSAQAASQRAAASLVSRADATSSLNTVEDWLEAAARGGPQRFAISQLMAEHQFGLCLTTLAAQIQEQGDQAMLVGRSADGRPIFRRRGSMSKGTSSASSKDLFKNAK